MVDETSTEKKLRIGLIHHLDARSVLSWSGIPFYMAKALNKNVGEVVFLGPDTSLIHRFTSRAISRINGAWKKLTGNGLVNGSSRSRSRRAAKFYQRRLAAEKCDIIFAPAAMVEIAEIRTELPIIYTSDANWADLIAYVPEVRPALESARIEGDLIEAAAINRADAVVYPSEWPVNTTLGHYRAPAEKVFVFPWGANLEAPPDRARALDHALGGRVNLLLVGVDWERKGGAIAFECLISLLNRNIDAHLTLCGCIPPSRFQHPNFHVIPFLNKHDPMQREQLTNLFYDAHFMLLPTRAEAFGIVICEASAHGLPVLVAETGGTNGALEDGVNGYLMPYDAGGLEYADRILSIIAHPEWYKALVVSSRDRYEKHLNWDAWACSMREVMQSVLKRRDRSEQRTHRPAMTPGRAAMPH
jgi:glycosyltransferase involved in cell wall biosynthesis